MATTKVCVRMGGIRLSLAMIVGLLVVPGFVVAPVLFSKLDTHTAGMVAGSIFHVANVSILLLSAAVVAFWMRLPSLGWLNWTLLMVIALLVCANEFAIAPVMQALKDATGDISALPKDDPQRMKFGMLHGISEIVHLLASIMAVVLVALGGNSKKA
ncbi:MAG: DUF4149 domain-containing protein [Zetaproteobacteria bacterium]|nr:DUF4149 domain-containing protein [Zetaproteobacteria bacterium]